MKFDCKQCGRCCRHVQFTTESARLLIAQGNESEVMKELAEFPYGWDENGWCEHLKDNRCDIYRTRPDICNVYKFWEKYLKDKMTLKQCYEVNKRGCEILNKE
jgi:Fe-S-cluster containining protein